MPPHQINREDCSSLLRNSKCLPLSWGLHHPNKFCFLLARGSLRLQILKMAPERLAAPINQGQMTVLSPAPSSPIETKWLGCVPRVHGSGGWAQGIKAAKLIKHPPPPRCAASGLWAINPPRPKQTAAVPPAFRPSEKERRKLICVLKPFHFSQSNYLHLSISLQIRAHSAGLDKP